MKRHLSAFAITSVFYLSLFGALTYSMAETLFIEKKEKPVENQRVSLSVFNPQPVVTPQKKVEKKVEKKPEKKIEKPIKKKTPPKPKKKIVKKEEPKPKKELPKQEPVKKVEKKIEEKIEKEVVKKEEPIKEEVKPKETPKKLVTQNTPKSNANKITNSKPKKVVDEAALKAKQDLFLAQLVKKINENKSYPFSARRRGIEGEVKMSFFLLANGMVENIKQLSGKSVFTKSAFSAIEKSFPLTMDKTLFAFPKEFTITIAYVLK